MRRARCYGRDARETPDVPFKFSVLSQPRRVSGKVDGCNIRVEKNARAPTSKIRDREIFEWRPRYMKIRHRGREEREGRKLSLLEGFLAVFRKRNLRPLYSLREPEDEFLRGCSVLLERNRRGGRGKGRRTGTATLGFIVCHFPVAPRRSDGRSSGAPRVNKFDKCARQTG